jgi:hypothetical protein
VWEAINNENSFSIVSSEEVAKIAKLIEERNAQKFLPFNETI